MNLSTFGTPVKQKRATPHRRVQTKKPGKLPAQKQVTTEQQFTAATVSRSTPASHRHGRSNSSLHIKPPLFSGRDGKAPAESRSPKTVRWHRPLLFQVQAARNSHPRSSFLKPSGLSIGAFSESHPASGSALTAKVGARSAQASGSKNRTFSDGCRILSWLPVSL